MIEFCEGIEFTERAKQILDGNGDGQQGGLGTASGRRAKIDRVKELLRDEGEGNQMEREELLGAYAERYDTDIEAAVEALKRASRGGDTMSLWRT